MKNSTPFDLNTAVKRSAEILLPLLGVQIEVRSFLATGLRPVRVNPIRIGEILGTIYANVRERMRRGGTLLLQTEGIEIRTKVPGPDDHLEGYVVLTAKSITQGEESGLDAFELDDLKRLLEETAGFMDVERHDELCTTLRLFLPVSPPGRVSSSKP